MITEVNLPKGAVYTHKTDQVVTSDWQVCAVRCSHTGCQGTLMKGLKGVCVSVRHWGCVRLASVTLLAAIGEDSLMMTAEIYYIFKEQKEMGFYP